MTAQPLPASTPAARGVDARGVGAFLDALEAAPGVEPHSLMIVRHGSVVASGWWAPYGADRPHLLYSLSKSFTSTAAGFAVAEGLLSLDDTVVSYFPEFDADITDPGSRAMLVRHVAAMASGHLSETLGRALDLDDAEPVRGFLLIPPDRAPGTVFAYNQPATYSLAAIVQRVTGQTLTEYLRPRLFDPLGIEEAAWQQDGAGRDIGYAGLHATTDAVARLGQLYLDNGVWQGEQLLPASWVAEATRSHVDNGDGSPAAAHSDWTRGYGFQFWMARHGYRGDGAYGQYCVVLPEQDVVIAMTGATEQMQTVLDLAWEHLLPAFGDAPAAGEAPDAETAEESALRERLAGLELPSLDAESEPSDAEAWADVEFTSEDGECPAQPTLTSVEIAEAVDGWTLSLVEGKAEGEPRLALPFTDTEWAVDGGPDASVPTALSAGWTDANTLVAEVVFLETPHRLILTCTLADRAFTARWHTSPMNVGPLRGYRAPRG